MPKKAEQQSGGSRLKSQGKSLVWVTLDAADKQLVRTAAAYSGLPMSEFLRQQGLDAAQKILHKIKDS